MARAHGRSAAGFTVLELLLVLSSSPPQPVYTRAPTRTAAIASTIAYLLRTILLLLQKRFRYYAWHCVGKPLAAVTP